MIELLLLADVNFPEHKVYFVCPLPFPSLCASRHQNRNTGQITPLQCSTASYTQRNIEKIINFSQTSTRPAQLCVAWICRPDHGQDFRLEKSENRAFNQNNSGEIESGADMFVFDAINPLASHPLIFKADIFRSYYRQERNYDF